MSAASVFDTVPAAGFSGRFGGVEPPFPYNLAIPVRELPFQLANCPPINAFPSLCRVTQRTLPSDPDPLSKLVSTLQVRFVELKIPLNRAIRRRETPSIEVKSPPITTLAVTDAAGSDVNST